MVSGDDLQEPFMQMMMRQAECVAELLKLLALLEVKAARCRVLRGPGQACPPASVGIW